jgi:hypothetical protein
VEFSRTVPVAIADAVVALSRRDPPRQRTSHRRRAGDEHVRVQSELNEDFFQARVDYQARDTVHQFFARYTFDERAAAAADGLRTVSLARSSRRISSSPAEYRNVRPIARCRRCGSATAVRE